MSLEKNFYKNIYDNFPEGIIVCDSDGKIIDVNKNFELLTGFSKNELLGKNFSDFIKSEKDSCSQCTQKLENHGLQNIKTHSIGEMRNKEDKLTCIRINFSITRDNKVIYIIIPLSDVAFLNQAHVDFVSTVSHELRTPLTSIKGFADTLLQSGSQLSAEQQNRFLNIIKSQVDRLTRLVENLLTVSKLESKRDKSIFKAIELPNFFKNILYNVQQKAQDHKIEVKIMPNLPPVWADSDKFEQIMTNLVDNAIKYSNGGTTVKIEARFIAGNTDFIEINVVDQGVGIPEEHISKIFSKFSRIDNALTRQVQGTGLGLYITKSLVESMEGKISLKSDGSGSTFTVILPVATYEKQIKQKFQEK